MLARKGTLTLRNGDTIELPRLVPSFSSKGFPFYREREAPIQARPTFSALGKHCTKCAQGFP